MSLNVYVWIALLLFAISLAGLVIHRKNIILLLVCIELLWLAVNTQFIAFSSAHHDIAGQVVVFFILTVAAAEAAIGLALVVLLYRNRHNIAIDTMNHLKG